MERQYEYRIKYQHADDVLTNYHYYQAETAEQALNYQLEMVEHHDWNIKILQVERKCPWSGNWEDKSEVLTNQTTTQINE